MNLPVDRPYRFPSLSQVGAGAPAHASAGSGAGAVSFGEAFQQGLDTGHAEGYESGLRTGREAGHAEGVRAGTQEGISQGLAQVHARFDALARPVDSLFAALQQMKHDYQSAIRSDMVELVAKVARQVIRAELALAPTQILKMVDETITALPPAGNDEIQVFLNPEELARIKELDPTRAGRWHLVADAQLEPGECRIRCGDREADAGCKQRLVAVMEQVSSQLHEAQGS